MPEKCSTCLKGIIPPNPISRHNGRSHHIDCYVCTLCTKPIIGVTNFPELLRCSKCIDEHGPKCFKCNTGFSLKLNMQSYVKIVNEEKYFHIDCSSCEKCGKNLTEKVYEQDGKFICFDCKNEEIQMSSEKCNKCDELITTTASVKYNNKTYHDKCLLCINCNEVLIDKFYKFNDREPLCDKCNKMEIIKKAHACYKCLNLITDYGFTLKDIESDERYYHQSCLTCYICNSILEDNQVILNSNEPYCKHCYIKTFATICHKCGISIDPTTKFILSEKNNYHEECFNSAGKNFSFNESEILC